MRFGKSSNERRVENYTNQQRKCPSSPIRGKAPPSNISLPRPKRGPFGFDLIPRWALCTGGAAETSTQDGSPSPGLSPLPRECPSLQQVRTSLRRGRGQVRPAEVLVSAPSSHRPGATELVWRGTARISAA
ncbi:Adhesion G Protein-Coupled Receptor B2 [Manis pentadactyla]|nr:Adhesion G Protein-Coupled Receptor B2 [Manis pentadactyla]